jgi:hypothetical protein
MQHKCTTRPCRSLLSPMTSSSALIVAKRQSPPSNVRYALIVAKGHANKTMDGVDADTAFPNSCLFVSNISYACMGRMCTR